MYLSTSTLTSEDDVTVTLTATDSGTAVMYIQKYNTTEYNVHKRDGTLTYPDPNVPGSYIATTAHDITRRNYLYLPGPHNYDTTYLITVLALTKVQCSIVARSTQAPILLQAGKIYNVYMCIFSTYGCILNIVSPFTVYFCVYTTYICI